VAEARPKRKRRGASAGAGQNPMTRGHAKAEWFRASRVYARLFADLVADVRAFGTSRVR